jgi:hypothetical protein
LKINLLIVFFLGFLHSVNAQKTDSIEWVSRGEYKLEKNDVWSVDLLGNVYISSKKLLNKFDTTGVLKFSQSIKSLGRIKQIQSINTMKLITFSEEQQSICVLDNTLTLSQECIDLSIFDIGYASHVAVSAQPDKMWVVDQLNSKLLLLCLGATNQCQEIKNLSGILNMSEIILIQEINSELFIADANGKVYKFDLYGTLLEVYDVTTLDAFAVKDEVLLTLKNNSLVFHALSPQIIHLPLEEVNDFKLAGNFFYFRTENKILKYSLVLRN